MPKAGRSAADRTPTFRSIVAAWLPTVASALALVVPVAATGQQRSHGPGVLTLSASTRALALGDAFALGDRDSDGIFYNPATLENAQGLSLGVQRYASAGVLATFSGAFEWLSGGVGIGVRMLQYGASTTDPEALSTDEAALGLDGPVGASEMVAAAGYAREIGGIRLGLAGKVIEQRLGDGRDETGAVDVGAAAGLGPVTIGLAAQNLGPGLQLGGGDLALQNRITLGASTPRRPTGPLDIGAAATVSRLGSGDLLAGGGLEVAWWPIVGRTFVGRVGVQWREEGTADPVTFGAAFYGDDFFVEYAYQGFERDGAHRIGIGWR